MVLPCSSCFWYFTLQINHVFMPFSCLVFKMAAKIKVLEAKPCVIRNFSMAVLMAKYYSPYKSLMNHKVHEAKHKGHKDFKLILCALRAYLVHFVVKKIAAKQPQLLPQRHRNRLFPLENLYLADGSFSGLLHFLLLFAGFLKDNTVQVLPPLLQVSDTSLFS